MQSARPPNANKKLWNFEELKKADICMPGFLPESQRPPRSSCPSRKCDSCKKECVSECICGESYCSRSCQVKEWKDHKNICDTLRDNNTMAFTFTELYWKTKGVK